MNRQHHQYDPTSDHYDDPHYGCATSIGLAMVILAFFLFALTGCKTVKVGQSHDRDSVRVEYRVDSFTQIIRDSVRVQLPCSDSIEVAYVDRWHTEYKDRTIKLHDTISVCSVDTIFQPYPVKEIVTKNSGFARFCIWWTIGTMLLMVLAIVCRVYLRR